jgi:hypothetical protein
MDRHLEVGHLQRGLSFVFRSFFLLTLVLILPSPGHSERPEARESAGGRPSNPNLHHDLPLVYRTASDTTWIRVHNPGESPCSPHDVSGSSKSQTIEHVWCFEGAGGDSSWPALPNPQGTRHERWDHWSIFDPPGPVFSKWHISQMNPNASTWNAWVGCDSIVGANGYSNNDDACTDIPFWINKKGYGDDWHYALELVASGASNASGSVVKFDVRYDTECNYDYLYVEYSTNNGTTWSFLRDSYPNGPPAVFNAVSGNPDAAHGGTGRSCGTDYFGNSDQFDPGGGNVNWNGNNHSLWIANVDFPIPVGGAGGVRIRWRAYSDGAWSDQDGRGDTDGLAAIDNVVLTINSGGTTATDNFETGTSSPLQGRVIATENITGAVTWSAGGSIGNTYDGWHLQFDPNYTNKGNTCDYSDDWMWAAKPAVGPIPPSANGFHFVLASPVIACSGWTGGLVEFSEYHCLPANTDDFVNQSYRVFDANLGWSTWAYFEGSNIEDWGCQSWNMNDVEDFSPYLGATIDSIQVAWEILDINQPGDFLWGKHSGVQYLIDNVSFGSFDATSTIFTARSIDLFADTFSQSDPAHTPFLQNAEQGIWSGLTAAPPGTRDFANADSLTIEVDDFNGVTATNVDLWWRHDNGGVGFGAFSKIDMTYSLPDPLSPTDEGTYRAIIGKDNGGTEDAFPPAGNRKIWKQGTTVQYYVKVVDNAAQTAVFPKTADDPAPVYLEFSVLPLGKTTPAGQKILLVDDFTRQLLDFENSSDFDPDGGMGEGTFLDPAFDEPENMVEQALVQLFGGSESAPKWDKYDVQGAGSSVQCEPRGIANPTLGLGGYMNSAGDPAYDVLIWLQGTFDAYSFADTTRIELKTYLDRNGNLFTCGDDIAYHLGEGGNDADSTIGFLGDYLGTSFTSSLDDATSDRILDMIGNAGTSLEGIELGLYGECAMGRSFDRLTLGAPAPESQNSVLATYTNGDAADNGRPCIIKNVRQGLDTTFGTADDGIAILAGFDLSALTSDASRACVLGSTLESDMEIALADPPDCSPSTHAPIVEARHGFDLSPANPNPFQKTTTIQFSMPSRQHVTISVHNVHGQTVRTLVNEILDANVHAREWDGRDESGRAVANGIYFVHMRANDFSAVKKVLRIR